MNKFTSAFIALAFLLLPARLFASVIYVIDDGGYSMDTQWQIVATGMGHTATIQPLTTLNVNTWFATVDALIVAGGTQTYTAAQMATVQAYLQTGKPVYLQGEYQSTYLTNQAFSNIVNAIGGSFTWGATVSGNLTPNVLGTFATTNNIVGSLPYFWYGVTGTGNSTVFPFIVSAGNVPLAWTFCPPAGGKMIMTTDQDWVNQSATYANSILLMQNVITHLFNPSLCGAPVTVITGTVVKTNVSCFGGNNGTATVTPTNGTGPYSYFWAPSGGTAATATGLAAGTYDVKITAFNGDTGHVAVVITQPTQITSTIAVIDAGCTGGNNGSATITAAGGTPGYTYSWAPSGGTGATATGLTAGSYTCTVTDANGCIHTSAVSTIAQPTITAQPQNTSVCDGSPASFSITVTGATGLTYQWQLNTGAGFNDITNGGIYSGATTSSLSISAVSAAMNGYQYRCKTGTTCTSNSAAATLTVKPLSTLTSPLTIPAVCSGLPVTYTPTASLTGTVISWTRATVPNISTPAASGFGGINETLTSTSNFPVLVTYVYTLAQNGCTKTQNVTVTINPRPAAVITPAGPPTTCDTLTLFGTPGQFSSYQWKKNGTTIAGATNATYLANTSGSYEFVSTNQYGCNRTSAPPLVVSILGTPVSVITYNTPLTFCEGNFVILNAPDPNQVSYTWFLNGNPINGATSNNYTVYQSGVYTVSKTNSNGCTRLSSGITVTVFPILNPIISRNGNILSTTGFASYQWYMNNTLIPGATGPSITITQNAFYQVVGTDPNGCITKSALAWIQNLAVSNPNINPSSIKIYPNPATDIVKVEAPIDVNITIRNMQGQLVAEKEMATQIDISSFAVGVYTITLTDKDGVVVKNEKLVKMGQ